MVGGSSVKPRRNQRETCEIRHGRYSQLVHAKMMRTAVALQSRYMGFRPSRLPSFSHRTESMGEQLDFGEHCREPLDQRDQPLVWHCGNEIVKHAPLAEQRMGALFARV
jgi:hypothetical protein